MVVKCGDAEVRAHRLVLAAASEYFRACLTGVCFTVVVYVSDGG